MLRSVSLCCLAAPALALLPALAGCGGQAPDFDNVVLITLDTVSPFLDELAAGGVVFEHAVSSSSHTAPAHASIFTSTYPAHHRVLVNGAALAEGIPTLAGLLTDGGFETAACPSVRFITGVTGGFGSVDGQVSEQLRHRPADETVDAALRWLDERPSRRRFLLWVHLYDAHQTDEKHHPPAAELERMQTDSRERGADLREYWTALHGVGTTDELAQRIDRYDAQIAFMDAQLRRLFERVEKGAGRTLWVITGDHGEALGDHDYIGHGQHLYEEQLRVPLILYGGGLPPGRRDALVRHVDLLPTVLELAGLPAAVEVEGRSLVPLLRRRATPPPALYAYSQRRPPHERPAYLRPPYPPDWDWEPGLVIAARNERYKYILHSAGEDEFFDLEHDPRELRNLIDEEHAAKDELARWLTEKYKAMIEHPLTDQVGEVDPRYVEELKALGYL
jgi:arylsulfatase A-like enzyme